MSRFLGLSFVVLAFAALIACEKKNTDLEPWTPREPISAPPEKDYSRPLAPGQLALRKIPPSQYPDFSQGYQNRAGLAESIQQSLVYLAKPSSQRYFPYGDVTHERAVDSLNVFLRILSQAQSPQEFDDLIKRNFEVYESVGWDDRGTVFFTGYYTPIFDGRLQPEGPFVYPLYKAPPDLVKDDEGRTLGRRLPDGQTVPFPTRREIESTGMLRGLEIAFLRSPFETYVVNVQGSARLRLADGSLYELGYAGNNGHDYRPIAKQMIDDGVIRRDELSLQTLLRYFEQHPDQIARYTWLNDRYIFFKQTSGGPFGSIGVPVTPYRTIATDKEVFPRAGLAYLVTQVPGPGGTAPTRFMQFACDQDTGGGIRAAGRCDIFIGIGDGAEAVAGRVGSEGRLYYVFVRPEVGSG